MKTIFATFTLLLVFGLASSNASADTYGLSGGMDVFQATTNASNTGSGTGTISGTYDDVTSQLDYTLTWAGLTSTVTGMHFHVGAAGVSGGVALSIPSPWTSAYTGSATLNSTQETGLLANDWYVNVHTSSFGGGEIRGQVLVSAVPEPASAGACILAAVAVCLRRRRTA